MSFQSLLSRFPVTAQLGAGFSFLLLVMMLVAGASLWGVTRLDRSVQMQDMAQDEWKEANRLATQVDALRAAASGFAATGDFDGVRRGAAMMKVISDLVAGIEDPAVRSELSERLTQFRRSFGRIAELQIEKNAAADDAGRARASAAMAALLDKDIVLASYGMTGIANSLRDAADARARAAEEATHRTTLSTIMISGGLSLAALVSGILLSIGIGRGISRPVGALTGALKRLADRDWDCPVPGEDRKDEIGAMARAVTVLRDSGARAERLDREAAERRSADLARAQAVQAMVDEFRAGAASLLAEVVAAGERLGSASTTLSALAGQTEGRAQSAVEQTRASSASSQSVAASAEELTASIDEIARQAVRAKTAVDQTVTQTDEANSRILSLNEVAGKVGAIVETIRSVAAQTNLLALNATIEAARAGEAGRGFAVVAAEVKQLAQQTAQATESITDQIAGIQQATAATARVVSAIAGAINGIGADTSGIAAAVEEQGAATQEISSHIGRVAEGSAAVAADLSELHTAAGQTAQIATEVLAAAGRMNATADQLNRRISHFLADVAAA